mmetsp:Transcript_35129/g.58185  ORF Transcript_35129/g.58185 Transcript_35129/m.58185 type:complete len:202 (-) Transcript_35129:13-618(-)
MVPCHPGTREDDPWWRPEEHILWCAPAAGTILFMVHCLNSALLLLLQCLNLALILNCALFLNNFPTDSGGLSCVATGRFGYTPWLKLAICARTLRPAAILFVVHCLNLALLLLLQYLNFARILNCALFLNDLPTDSGGLSCVATGRFRYSPWLEVAICARTQRLRQDTISARAVHQCQRLYFPLKSANLRQQIYGIRIGCH